MKTAINNLLYTGRIITMMFIYGLTLNGCSTQVDPAPVPTASFTFEISGSVVSFNNTSENANDFLWEFGDGTTSSDKNPSKTYTENNEYSVTLTSTGDGGSKKSTQTVIIDVALTPTSSFEYTVTNFEVVFSNTSSNSTKYKWDFGDGTTSSEKNPSKTYSENKEYSVTLTSSGDGGSNKSTQTVIIDVAPTPTSSFDFTVTGFKVTFSNSSTNATEYNWDFGDGSTSIEKDPVRTYVANGTYEVELTSSSEGGTAKSSKSITIEVAPVPVSAFSFYVTDSNVTFTNESTNATTYNWDFGDGTSSTEQHPSKTYATNGIYDVVLKVEGEGGTNTSSQEVIIAVSIPLPNSFISDFYTLAGDPKYVLSSNSSGDYIKIDAEEYYYNDTKDVSFSSVIVVGFGTFEVYKVIGSSPGGLTQTFWIYQEGTEFKDTNKLFVSLSAEDAGYTTYANVGGRTVTKVVYNSTRGSFVYNSGADQWCEYQTNGGTNCDFTEDSRDDWSVVLSKADGSRVVLNTNTMKVLYEPSGGSFSDLYTIIEVSR